MSEQVEIMEPCCYVRMRRAGWSAAQIAELFGIHITEVARAIQQAHRDEMGVDRKRIFQ